MRLYQRALAALLLGALLSSAVFGCARPSIAVLAAPAASLAPVTTPSPTATPSPTPTPAPTATLVPTATPVPTPFSVVWLSDTQMMAFAHPDALAAMGAWIASNREAENIVQVVQTGDAVEHGANALQWEAFDLCYNAFCDDVPYFAITGNHEPGVREKDTSLFLSRPYVANLPDAQKTQGGMAAYTTFTAGGCDFLMLGAGWGAELAALDWMDSVLSQYADYTAILLFHSFITPGGRVYDKFLPLYDRLVCAHPNVRMVLCGHVRGRTHRIDALDDDGDGKPDRSVSIQLMNYQDETTDCGQMRILTFDPVSRAVTIRTYSPVTERFYRDGTHGEYSFTMENAF